MSRTPAAEEIVDEAMVGRLIAAQFPILASLPVGLLGHGWDNWLFRLGEAYSVRLPRRASAVPLLENESRVLPILAPRLPIPVPLALHKGEPGEGYPWPWLIAPYYYGDNPDRCPLESDQAVRLARFLIALHQPDDGLAPANDHRDIPLAQREMALAAHWRSLELRDEGIGANLAELWERAKAEPRPAVPVWIHGDLHYANVLVSAGVFSAIIDWGDVCAGDPATDLAALWILFADPAARRAGLAEYGADAGITLRAMGWALSFATVMRATGLVDNPRHAAVGLAVLDRLRSDLKAI